MRDLGLVGKVAIVTGASSGIGRATAIAFGREGAKVALTFEDGSPMNDAISSFILYNRNDCGGSPTLTYSRLYVDSNNHLSLKFCGKNIHQDVYIGAKREGQDFGIHTKRVDFGMSEQCATSENLTGGSVRPATLYQSGVALNQQDVYHVCNSSGLCNSIRTSPAEPVTPPPPPSGGDCPVPFYSQSGWGGGNIGNCTCTITRCGCALTSLSMVYKYYGADQTPPSLARCLGGNACPLVWTDRCSDGKVNYRGWVSFSWNRLESELAQGRPVILQLNRTDGMHFVVAVSGSGDQASGYFVNDPWLQQGAYVKLSAVLARQNYRISSMRLYSGIPDCTYQTVTPNERGNGVPVVSVNDPSSPITGSIDIYRNTETTMTLALNAYSNDGTVTDMLIWTDSVTNTTWQPFSPYVAITLSEQFFVQFRDSSGNISAVISNTSDPESPAQIFPTFLPVVLRRM